MSIRHTILLAFLIVHCYISQANNCQKSLDHIRENLAKIISDIEEKPFSQRQAKAIIDWSDNFREDYFTYSAWGQEALPGTASWAVSRLLTSGLVHASALGISTIRNVGWEEVSRWALEPETYWHDARLNAAIFDYLGEYVDDGGKGVVSQQVVDFIKLHRRMLQELLQTEVPIDKPSLEKFLPPHAFQLYYFLGRLEEEMGATDFIRHKWPFVQGTYGGNRQEVGYYRKVIHAQLKEELLRLHNELGQIAPCNEVARIDMASLEDSGNDTLHEIIQPVNPQLSRTNMPGDTSFPKISIIDTSGNIFDGPTVGGGIGFGFGDGDNGFCLEGIYQRPLGQRFGNCNSQARYGAAIAYERQSQKNDAFTFRQQWIEVQPHIQLQTPLNGVDLLSGIAVPIGFGNSKQRISTPGVEDPPQTNLNRWGINLQGGISFVHAGLQFQLLTDLLSFTRTTFKDSENPEFKSTSGNFNLMLNKHNQLKFRVQMPLNRNE